MRREPWVVGGLCTIVLLVLGAFFLALTDGSSGQEDAVGPPGDGYGTAIDHEIPGTGIGDAGAVALRQSQSGDTDRRDVAISDDAGEAAEESAATHAVNELRLHAEDALDGAIYVDAIVEYALILARGEISEHVDFDYEDNDSLAYSIDCDVPDVDVHMLVGLQPYRLGDVSYRTIGMDIAIDQGKEEVSRGVARRGSQIEFVIAYDEEHPETPTKFSLLVHKPVAIAESREAGIDVLHGQNTQGAMYVLDLQESPDEPHTQTYGIVDGLPTGGPEFMSISPLVGDTVLDTEGLSALFSQLQRHQKRIRGDTQFVNR